MTSLDSALAGVEQALAAFHVVLQAEAAAIASLNTEQLTELLQRKQPLIVATAKTWNILLQTLNLSTPDKASVQQRLSDTPQHLARWEKIRELAKDVESLNNQNAHLADLQMVRARQALDVLQSAANQSRVYGSDGQFNDGLFGRRDIGQA